MCDSPKKVSVALPTGYNAKLFRYGPRVASGSGIVVVRRMARNYGYS